MSNPLADYDPVVIEQKEQSQPACLPLSYVLRFITDAARKESPFLATTGVEMKRKLAIKHHSYSMSSSNRSNTPTGKQISFIENEMRSIFVMGLSIHLLVRHGTNIKYNIK